MTVVANYIGQKDDNMYWVNVKTANPTGNIGDAGVIRRFNTQEEAKTYTNEVNQTGVDSFVKTNNMAEEPVRHQGDVFVPSINSR